MATPGPSSPHRETADIGTLDDLLADLREKGVLDSTDTFGVDTERAVSKAGRFQLADPGHYLLKILQAAETAKATAVTVWLGQAEVRVHYSYPAAPNDVDRLSDSRAQNEHLILGMRAATTHRPTDMFWQCWTADRGAQLTLNPEGALKVTACGPRSPAPGGYFCMLKPKAFYSFLLGEPSMAPEHDAVSSRARYFPVPLKLDGRYVNGSPPKLSWTPVSVAGQSVHPEANLVRRLLVARERSMLARCSPNQTMLYEVEHQVRESSGCSHDSLFFQRARTFLTQFSRVTYEQPWFPLDYKPLTVGSGAEGLVLERKPGGERFVLRLPTSEELPEHLSCHADVSLRVNMEGPGEVTFVKHGVSLTPIRADLGCPGARAVVCLPVTTDLSQFAAVQNPALQNVLLFLKAHIKSMLIDARTRLPRLWLDHPELRGHLQDRLQGILERK